MFRNHPLKSWFTVVAGNTHCIHFHSCLLHRVIYQGKERYEYFSAGNRSQNRGLYFTFCSKNGTGKTI